LHAADVGRGDALAPELNQLIRQRFARMEVPPQHPVDEREGRAVAAGVLRSFTRTPVTELLQFPDEVQGDVTDGELHEAVARGRQIHHPGERGVAAEGDGAAALPAVEAPSEAEDP